VQIWRNGWGFGNDFHREKGKKVALAAEASQKGKK